MSDEVLVRVENVSKKYCRSLRRSMLYGVEDIARDILHLPPKSGCLRKEEFWAVQDVSFELRRGECLGIIGPNGAGKSTLLKMLNGIVLPDKGKITVRGKVGALIEVGAGFHPMLTGRENIYISGAILGLSKKEIDKKFDEVVAFAELEDFIDTPVKHYSSGMYVRLGFAIAVHVNVDVLLLDEVLAVGDLSFVAKCFTRISALKQDTAIVVISHDMRVVARLCSVGALMDRGVLASFTVPSDAIDEYIRKVSASSALSPISKTDSEVVKIVLFRVKGDKSKVSQFDDIELEICLNVKKLHPIHINVAVHRDDGLHCFGIIKDLREIVGDYSYGLVFVRLIIKNISLMPGIYFVSLYILDENKFGILSFYESAVRLVIHGCHLTKGVYMPTCVWKKLGLKGKAYD